MSGPDTDKTHILMTADSMRLCLDRLADELLRRHGGCDNLALIGIQRRGVTIASALSARMAAALGRPVFTGSLDITLYRDDWTSQAPKPAVGETRIPFDVQGKNLVLVDDVLFTGRTIRAALEALADFGRPSKVELLVLVDRGGRELPIHPDYVGLTCETRHEDQVDVLVTSFDGEDGVRLVRA
jgi:pyrimidine operon attenuation protein/uracil phosphoribosyltransferase